MYKLNIKQAFSTVLTTICSALFMTSCSNGQQTNNGDAAKTDTSTMSEIQTNKNMYTDMRNMAFSVTPQQLGITIADDKTTVYGVIMDWGMDANTATLVAYQTGDASIYLSSGGGTIGGGQHASVSKVAKQYISQAQSFMAHAAKTDNTQLPADNEVIFYLLTNNGIYTGRDNINNFENASSAWLPMFTNANDVITALRQVSE